MPTYEVVIDVDPTLAEPLARFMREQHIPEILATGCFRRISFEQATGTRFRASYHADTTGDLERYLTVHTTAMRADFIAHFSTGVAATRETWSSMGEWERDAGRATRVG